MGRALQAVTRKERQEMKKKSAKTEETWMDMYEYCVECPEYEEKE